MGNGASMSPREDDGVRYKGGSVPEPTNVEGAWLQKALRLIRSDTYDAFSELLRKATRDNKEGSRKKRLSDAAWVAMLRDAAAPKAARLLAVSLLLLSFIFTRTAADRGAVV